MSELIAYLLGVATGLTGAFVTHRLNLSRETRAGRASRRREFLAFCRAWCVDIDRTFIVGGGVDWNWKALQEQLPKFRHVAELMRHDFTGKKLTRFDALIQAVIQSEKDKRNRGGQEISQKAIEAIADYVETA